MSDTPIFDRLVRERGIRRSMSPEGITRVFGTSEVSKAPDEYLDGPLHFIGAQKFDDGEVSVTPYVVEKAMAGITGSPFDRIKFLTNPEVPYGHVMPVPPKVSLWTGEEDHHGTTVWSEMTDKERKEQMSEMFQKHVSDVSQAIRSIQDQGGIITKVEHVKQPNGDVTCVVDGAVPDYKPLFEGEANEE